MRITGSGLCLGLLFLLASAPPVVGQQTENPYQARHRNNCRLAVQALRTGHPHPKYTWAREYLMTCRDDAPEVLVEMWRRTLRADTQDVVAAARASGQIKDRRIYQAMLATVLDRSRPDVVRVGAMVALMRYIDRYGGLTIFDLIPPRAPNERVPIVTVFSTDGSQATGPEPLREPVGRPVLALLKEVADGRAIESYPVWYAAAALSKTLALRLAAGEVQ
jgi:hypothetical protein